LSFLFGNLYKKEIITHTSVIGCVSGRYTREGKVSSSNSCANELLASTDTTANIRFGLGIVTFFHIREVLINASFDFLKTLYNHYISLHAHRTSLLILGIGKQ
jgi:hypothetical protein